MDRQKQIEEMAKDIANSGVFMVTDSNTIARVVIDLGYRKIPEGGVVLTRGEYERQQKDKLIERIINANESELLELQKELKAVKEAGILFGAG